MNVRTSGSRQSAVGNRSKRRPRISAWHAIDDGRGPWFPVAAMQRIGVIVELACNGARQIVGKLDRHPRNKRLFWWEWRDLIEEFSPLQMWTPPVAPLPDRLSDRTPLAWRPLVPGVWPDPLPEPLFQAAGSRQQAAGPQRSPECQWHGNAAACPLMPAACCLLPDPPPPPEPHGWPYPGLKLGESVPPTSKEEAEARVLRAWRTLTVLPGHDYVGGGDLCWPRDWYVLGQRIDALERYLNGERETHVPPVRSTWLATRRDQGDWRYALAWMNGLSEAHREIIRLRAADPPYRWGEIARQMSRKGEALSGITRAGAQWRYEAAIDAVWEAARAAA